MFTAYFDASGSENDQLCLAVGGFVATDQDWVTFERQWLTRLAEDGLQRFHTKELQAWEREKRTKLINDLIELIAGTVARKFGAVVQNDSLSLLSADERRKWHIRPYSLAGRVCAAHIRQWSTRDRIGYVPNLIFADGDLGKAIS
jgi:prophage tail gpP-like protein